MNTDITTHFERLIDTLRPSAIGYDSIWDDVFDIVKKVPSKVSGYPPYNIRYDEEERAMVSTIEIAVAGFEKDQISIQLDKGKLKVVGAGSPDEQTDDNGFYHWKGIANRNFTLTFHIAENAIVDEAEMKNGLLKIRVLVPKMTEMELKQIPIK